MRASKAYICKKIKIILYLNWNKSRLVDSYPDEVGECVVDVGSPWHEETTARAEIMEKEQLLILWSRQIRLFFFNDFTYPYLQVQPASSSFMHSRVLSSLHTADYLSATHSWKKLSGLESKAKGTDVFGVKTKCSLARQEEGPN